MRAERYKFGRAPGYLLRGRAHDSNLRAPRGQLRARNKCFRSRSLSTACTQSAPSRHTRAGAPIGGRSPSERAGERDGEMIACAGRACAIQPAACLFLATEMHTIGARAVNPSLAQSRKRRRRRRNERAQINVNLYRPRVSSSKACGERARVRPDQRQEAQVGSGQQVARAGPLAAAKV